MRLHQHSSILGQSRVVSRIWKNRIESRYLYDSILISCDGRVKKHGTFSRWPIRFVEYHAKPRTRLNIFAPFLSECREQSKNFWRNHKFVAFASLFLLISIQSMKILNNFCQTMHVSHQFPKKFGALHSVWPDVNSSKVFLTKQQIHHVWRKKMFW